MTQKSGKSQTAGGLVFVIIGFTFMIATGSHHSSMNLGTGIVFLVIGLAMLVSNWRARLLS